MSRYVNAIFFRKEMPQADDLIEEAKEIYCRIGAIWRDQKKLFEFGNGSRVRFRPLETEKDAEKFQGQNLCVAVGTPVRMGDGSFKEIQNIKVGDHVATLEGPKKVTRTTDPYVAPCVQCRVLDQDGIEIGSQVHPVWHPVLTSSGVFSSAEEIERHTVQTPHIHEQSQSKVSDPCSESSRSYLCADLVSLAWFAYSEGERIYYKESWDDTLEKQPLRVLSVPVVLHEQTVRLARKLLHYGRDDATQYRAQHKCDERLLDSFLRSQKESSDLVQRCEPFQQLQDRRGEISCGATDARSMSHKDADSQDDYRSCRDLYDEQSHPYLKSGPSYIQQLNDVAESCQIAPLGELDTTQKHNHKHSRSWVHPYTGEVRNLVEDVQFGMMEVSYFGESLVSDLTVEDVNHYITDTGLINKNTDCAVEECGNYEGVEGNKPPPAIFKLFGAMRSKHGVPTQLILTANPGGIGQNWIRERYIDPAPLGMVPLTEVNDGKVHKRIYIPSRVFDNKILLLKNPNYIANLHRVGSKQLVQAWLFGDWTQIIGAFFSEFKADKHIIPPFKLPRRWRRLVGYDWGHHSPACAVWGCVSDGKDDEGREVYTSDGRHIPKGAVVLYREYTCRQTPNETMAKQILELSANETIDTKVADPSIFNSQGGESIADQFQKCGLYFQRADNDRQSGWMQFRKRLQPTQNDSSPPLLYLFSTMTYGIRTLPSAPISPRDAEDLDTKSDDHWLDAARYLLKEVQITDTEYKAPVVQATKGVIHLNKLLETHKRNKSKRKL